MKYLLNLIFWTILILILSNCTAKMELPSYNGIWKSIGHGEFLEITGADTYAFYDITSLSCLPRRKGRLDEITKVLTLKSDTLSLQIGAITTRYTKAPKLPTLCSQDLDAKKANDLHYNFEVFMETVKEHYAFLKLNEIDWDELYQNQKAKLTPNSNQADLLLLIEDTYEKLNDNHAYLNATDEVYDLVDELYPVEEQPKDTLAFLGDFFVAKEVSQSHLKEDMTKDSWLIHWGKIKDDMGYIQLLAMNMFAGPSQSAIDSVGWENAFIQARDALHEAAYLKKEVEGASQIMDRVMKDLRAMESIIIDIRFNGGGHDVVSFEILSRFIKGKVRVANHKFSYSNQHTPIDPIYINGSENPYLKPVYILTSPQTGSAAEVFSIASMPLAHVKRIGATTMGAMSTTLDKFLPNGWEFAVSNEVYMDNDYVGYENIGIPVHYELDYSADRQAFFRTVVDDLKKDKQNILEAIELIKKK